MIDVGVVWTITKVQSALAERRDQIGASLRGVGPITLRIELSPRERDVLLRGGLLAAFGDQI